MNIKEEAQATIKVLSSEIEKYVDKFESCKRSELIDFMCTIRHYLGFESLDITKIAIIEHYDLPVIEEFKIELDIIGSILSTIREIHESIEPSWFNKSIAEQAKSICAVKRLMNGGE